MTTEQQATEVSKSYVDAEHALNESDQTRTQTTGMILAIIGFGAVVSEIGEMGLRQQNQAIAALVCLIAMIIYFKPSNNS